MKQLDGTGLKRLHREWRRRTERAPRPRARRRAGPVQRRRDHPHRGRAARRATCGWRGAPRVRRTTKVARPRSAPSATSRSTAPHDGAAAVAGRPGRRVPGRRHRAGRRRRAAARARPRRGDLPRRRATRTAGCSPAALAACDAVAFLPQLGRVGSLNVATAASIACYEVRRRAWTDPRDRCRRAKRRGRRRGSPRFSAMAEPSVRLPHRRRARRGQPSSSVARCSARWPTSVARGLGRRVPRQGNPTHGAFVDKELVGVCHVVPGPPRHPGPAARRRGRHRRCRSSRTTAARVTSPG